MNKCIEVGRMTKDAELRRTGNGMAVATFTLAVNRPFTDQKGERQADFIPCVVWGKLAENVAKYCSKGSQIAVDGMLQSRTYEDNNKQKKFILELVCSNVEFLSTNSNSNKQQTQNNYSHDDILKDFDNAFDSFDISDEDMQF